MSILTRLLHPGGGVEEDATEDRDPLPPAPKNHIAVSNPAPGLYEIVTGGRPLPTFAELRARYPLGGPSNDSPEVDFRAMLKNDDQAWSTKARLQAVLGRPYLATALVDQLDPETAATLADRLEVFVRDALEKVAHDVDIAVERKMIALREEATDRAKEVSRERFGRPSRLD